MLITVEEVIKPNEIVNPKQKIVKYRAIILVDEKIKKVEKIAKLNERMMNFLIPYLETK